VNKSLHGQKERQGPGKSLRADWCPNLKRFDTGKSLDGMKPNDEVVRFANLEEFTAGLRKQFEEGDTNPELQTAINRKVVERIELLPEGYEISFHVGQNHYRAELGSNPGSAIFSEVAKKKRPALLREPCLNANPKKNVAGSIFLLSGGVCAKLPELAGPVVSTSYKLSWEREYLDLSELARLRWVERWKIESLADYFGSSRTAVKERLRAIKREPSRVSVAVPKVVLRGR
jgi:hypothetical protein